MFQSMFSTWGDIIRVIELMFATVSRTFLLRSKLEIVQTPSAQFIQTVSGQFMYFQFVQSVTRQILYFQSFFLMTRCFKISFSTRRDTIKVIELMFATVSRTFCIEDLCRFNLTGLSEVKIFNFFSQCLRQCRNISS